MTTHVFLEGTNLLTTFLFYRLKKFIIHYIYYNREISVVCRIIAAPKIEFAVHMSFHIYYFHIDLLPLIPLGI